MDMENFIKNLSPELQEKARQCGSIDELIALAGEEKVELPDEALAAIAGGSGDNSQRCKNKSRTRCPKCGSGSDKITLLSRKKEYGMVSLHLKCENCGEKWFYTEGI